VGLRCISGNGIRQRHRSRRRRDDPARRRLIARAGPADGRFGPVPVPVGLSPTACSRGLAPNWAARIVSDLARRITFCIPITGSPLRHSALDSRSFHVAGLRGRPTADQASRPHENGQGNPLRNSGVDEPNDR